MAEMLLIMFTEKVKSYKRAPRGGLTVDVLPPKPSGRGLQKRLEAGAAMQ